MTGIFRIADYGEWVGREEIRQYRTETFAPRPENYNYRHWNSSWVILPDGNGGATGKVYWMGFDPTTEPLVVTDTGILPRRVRQDAGRMADGGAARDARSRCRGRQRQPARQPAEPLKEIAMNHRVLAVMLALVVPALFLPAAAAGQAAESAPMTAWGHPDLQGVWTNKTTTPPGASRGPGRQDGADRRGVGAAQSRGGPERRPPERRSGRLLQTTTGWSRASCRRRPR